MGMAYSMQGVGVMGMAYSKQGVGVMGMAYSKQGVWGWALLFIYLAVPGPSYGTWDL